MTEIVSNIRTSVDLLVSELIECRKTCDELPCLVDAHEKAKQKLLKINEVLKSKPRGSETMI